MEQEAEPREELWHQVIYPGFLNKFDELSESEGEGILRRMRKLQQGDWTSLKRQKALCVETVRSRNTTREEWSTNFQYFVERGRRHHIVLWVEVSHRHQCQILAFYDIVTDESELACVTQVERYRRTQREKYLKGCKKGLVEQKVFRPVELREEMDASFQFEPAILEEEPEDPLGTHVSLQKKHLVEYRLFQHIIKYGLKYIEPPYEFDIFEEEAFVQIGQRVTFILGRSGSGKTSVLVRSLCQAAQAEVPAALVTWSPRLARAIGVYVQKMLRAHTMAQQGEAADPVGPFVADLREGGPAVAQGQQEPTNSPRSFLVAEYNPAEAGPLVLHWGQFLKMADNSINGDRFFKEGSRAQEALHRNRVRQQAQGQDRGGGSYFEGDLLTYEFFVETMLPELYNFKALSKSHSPYLVFKEFITILGGSLQAAFTEGGIVSQEHYVSGRMENGRPLPELKDSFTVSEAERAHIYEAFKKYNSLKLKHHRYDVTDPPRQMIVRIRQHGLPDVRQLQMFLNDEAQDLVPIQIALQKYFCSNLDGFVFAGDTAQTISKGVEFSFETLRRIFYELFVLGDKVRRLQVEQVDPEICNTCKEAILEVGGMEFKCQKNCGGLFHICKGCLGSFRDEHQPPSSKKGLSQTERGLVECARKWGKAICPFDNFAFRETPIVPPLPEQLRAAGAKMKSMPGVMQLQTGTNPGVGGGPSGSRGNNGGPGHDDNNDDNGDGDERARRGFEYGPVPPTLQLRGAHRSGAAIYKLASSLLDVLGAYFPGSVDQVQPEINRAASETPVVVTGLSFCEAEPILQSHAETGEDIALEFGAGQVIVTFHEDDYNLIVARFPDALVIAVWDIKGLEFQDALLYNPLRRLANSIPNGKLAWELVTSFLEGATEIDTSGDQCALYKTLYVAMTRARRKLWILEEHTADGQAILDFWINKGLVQAKTEGLHFAIATGPEEWMRKGIDFFEDKNFALAVKCFKNANARKHITAQHYQTLAIACEHEEQARNKSANVRQEHLQEASALFETLATEKSELYELFIELHGWTVNELLRRAAHPAAEMGHYVRAGNLLKRAGDFADAAETFEAGKAWGSAARCWMLAFEYHNAFACYARAEAWEETQEALSIVPEEEKQAVSQTFLRFASSKEGSEDSLDTYLDPVQEMVLNECVGLLRPAQRQKYVEDLPYLPFQSVWCQEQGLRGSFEDVLRRGSWRATTTLETQELLLRRWGNLRNLSESEWEHLESLIAMLKFLRSEAPVPTTHCLPLASPAQQLLLLVAADLKARPGWKHFGALANFFQSGPVSTLPIRRMLMEESAAWQAKVSHNEQWLTVASDLLQAVEVEAGSYMAMGLPLADNEKAKLSGWKLVRLASARLQLLKVACALLLAKWLADSICQSTAKSHSLEVISNYMFASMFVGRLAIAGEADMTLKAIDIAGSFRTLTWMNLEPLREYSPAPTYKWGVAKWRTCLINISVNHNQTLARVLGTLVTPTPAMQTELAGRPCHCSKLPESHPWSVDTLQTWMAIGMDKLEVPNRGRVAEHLRTSGRCADLVLATATMRLAHRLAANTKVDHWILKGLERSGAFQLDPQTRDLSDKSLYDFIDSQYNVLAYMSDLWEGKRQENFKSVLQVVDPGTLAFLLERALSWATLVITECCTMLIPTSWVHRHLLGHEEIIEKLLILGRKVRQTRPKLGRVRFLRRTAFSMVKKVMGCLLSMMTFKQNVFTRWVEENEASEALDQFVVIFYCCRAQGLTKTMLRDRSAFQGTNPGIEEETEKREKDIALFKELDPVWVRKHTGSPKLCDLAASPLTEVTNGGPDQTNRMMPAFQGALEEAQDPLVGLSRSDATNNEKIKFPLWVRAQVKLAGIEYTRPKVEFVFDGKTCKPLTLGLVPPPPVHSTDRKRRQCRLAEAHSELAASPPELYEPPQPTREDQHGVVSCESNYKEPTNREHKLMRNIWSAWTEHVKEAVAKRYAILETGQAGEHFSAAWKTSEKVNQVRDELLEHVNTSSRKALDLLEEVEEEVAKLVKNSLESPSRRQATFENDFAEWYFCQTTELDRLLANIKMKPVLWPEYTCAPLPPTTLYEQNLIEEAFDAWRRSLRSSDGVEAAAAATAAAAAAAAEDSEYELMTNESTRSTTSEEGYFFIEHSGESGRCHKEPAAFTAVGPTIRFTSPRSSDDNNVDCFAGCSRS